MATAEKLLTIPTAEEALPGRDELMPVPAKHYVNGNPMKGPWPDHLEVAHLGLGCFWGAERLFYKIEGVYSSATGYQAGMTPNPTYEEVCSGRTGHAETVQIVFDPKVVSFKELITIFFESHDPTQGMRQGGDIGTQYRSIVLYHNDEQKAQAEEALANYNGLISQEGHGPITTEIVPVDEFYYAEEYHQQYLAKNPQGYCGIGGLGVCFPPEKS